MSLVQIRIIETVVNVPEEQRANYKVSFEVILAQGISSGLFVYQRDGDLYSHPASVFDLNTYPDHSDADFDFYRRNYAELTYRSIKDAKDAAHSTMSRLKNTMSYWDKTYQIPFGGTRIESMGSDAL